MTKRWFTFTLIVLSAFLAGLFVHAVFFTGRPATPANTASIQAQNPLPEPQAAPPAKSTTPKATVRSNPLDVESARLAQLNATLATVLQTAEPTPEFITNQIAGVNSRMAALSARATELANQEQQAKRNARVFQNQVTFTQVNNVMGLEAEVQSANSTLIDLQNEAAFSPAPQGVQLQIANLIAYRDLLLSQIRSLGSALRGNEVAVAQRLLSEREEIRLEKVALDQEMSDARNELAYWNEQGRALSAQARQVRIDGLNSQIAIQQQRVEEAKRGNFPRTGP